MHFLGGNIMEKEIVTPVEAIIEKEVTANEMKKNEKESEED